MVELRVVTQKGLGKVVALRPSVQPRLRNKNQRRQKKKKCIIPGYASWCSRGELQGETAASIKVC